MVGTIFSYFTVFIFYIYFFARFKSTIAHNNIYFVLFH